MPASLLECDLQREPAAGNRARRAVEPLIGRRLRRDEGDDVLLLTTELVTNAVRHGAGELVSLCAVRNATGLRVEVSSEASAKTPEPTSGGPDGGWGLQLVRGLSSTWGQHTDDGRTLVWFELSVPRPA